MGIPTSFPSKFLVSLPLHRRRNPVPFHLCSLAIPVQFESNKHQHPIGILSSPIDIHLLRTVGPLAQLPLWFANWASILPVTTPSVWTTRSVLPQPISNLSLTLTPAVACRWSTFALCATCHRPINYYYSFILFSCLLDSTARGRFSQIFRVGPGRAHT